MLPGFGQHTAPLTHEEQSLVPFFVKGLSTKIGTRNAITSREMISAFRSKKGIELTGPRVRKIINYIRMNNLVPGLVASSTGYYVSDNPMELKEYMQSLEGRIKAIEGIRQAIQRHYDRVAKGIQLTIK